jgi:hypothetical protein
MTRIATIVAAAALILGVAGWRSGTARGTVEAIIDHARGRPASYSLGCTSEWPREPRDFRTYEILARDYHMSFITIGGIAPTPFQSDFADAYDRVSYKLLRLRYGEHFADDVRRRAAADVYDHNVTVEGCYWGVSELVMPDRDIITVSGPPEIMGALAASEKKTVRVTGMMTDVRGSIWRSAGRPQIRVARVQVLGDACGKR